MYFPVGAIVYRDLSGMLCKEPKQRGGQMCMVQAGPGTGWQADPTKLCPRTHHQVYSGATVCPVSALR